METAVVIFDVISAVSFAAAIFLTTRIPQNIIDNTSKLFLYLCFSIYAAVSASNILEHAHITNYFDAYEDYIEILFVPFFLFFIYSLNIQYELNKRRQAEGNLLRSEKNFRNLFESANDAIFILDIEGNFIDMNSIAFERLGYTKEELLSKNVSVIDSPEFAARVPERIEMIKKYGKAMFESAHIKKDSTTMPVEVNSRIIDFQGRKALLSIIRDITERKKADEALRESEERYRLLFQHSPIGIFNYDLELRITECNERFAEIVHLQCGQIRGLDLKQLKVPNATSALNNALKGGTGSYEGLCLLSPEPGETWVYLQTAPFFDASGNIKGGVGIVEDITERRKTHETLQETTRMLQSLIQASPLAILMVDPEGMIKFWGPAAEHMFGWKSEEVLGLPNPIVPEDKREEFKSFIVRLLQGESFMGMELKRQKKDGTLIDISLSTAPVHDVEGRITGIMAMIADISKRKKMEEQIFQIQHDWEDTFNIITDMITVHDRDFNIIRANKAAEKILGLPFLDAAKAKCYKYYHGTKCPPEGCPSCQTLVTGVPAVSEMFEPHLNKFIEIRAIPRFDSKNNLTGLIHVVRDITERRKLENQLRQSQKMEAIGQLAGGIAHDFNNIITAIIGYASIMKMKVGQDDPLRISIDQVLSSSEKATNLVQSLLAFSRKQISNPEPVKINGVIKSIEKLLARVIGEDIELRIELKEDLTVTADIVQIEQVLMNLCTNARDAMPGGGTLTIKTEVAELTRDFTMAHGYGEEGRYIHISVSDTGAGMDEKTRERIFEPFFTTKEVGKGTGLGLAIVYGIIKQHKGYITCQSEKGKGTLFNIYLPAAKAAVREIQPVRLSELTEATGTILFAEDEEELRNLTKQMLEDAGYKVIDAVDGADTVNKFMENKDIDLLLLDVIMPNMSGKEAYDKIRKIQPDIKVLFISGYPADFIGKYGVVEQGLNFISKPVSPTVLLRKITEVLGNGA